MYPVKWNEKEWKFIGLLCGNPVCILFFFFFFFFYLNLRHSILINWFLMLTWITFIHLYLNVSHWTPQKIVSFCNFHVYLVCVICVLCFISLVEMDVERPQFVDCAKCTKNNVTFLFTCTFKGAQHEESCFLFVPINTKSARIA